MNIKLFIIIAISSFGMMIAGSIISNILVSKGFISNPLIEKIVFIFFCLLFLALAFAIVPIFIRAFITAQTKIGNGNLPIIRWLKKNETKTIFFLLGFFLLGMIIALPAIIKDWFLK